MNVLLGTVIYSGVDGYIGEFVECVNKQTYNHFDTVIINDGYQNNAYIEFIKKSIDGCIIIDFRTKNLNPSELRKEIIKYASKNKYHLLIWADIDDTFSYNRVEKYIKSYKEDIAFYYNDLIIKGSSIDFFHGKLKDEVSDKKELDNSNFVGLSNSGVNINLIKPYIHEIGNLDECIAFDWYLYTYLLKQGLRGIKAREAKTYYNIHNNNIAGFTNNLNNKKLELGIKIKKFQYKSLKKYDVEFVHKLIELDKLEKYISNEEYRLKYIKYVNENFKDNVYWWENILLSIDVEVLK